MSENQRLISFDLKAEMGFLKKPDINDGIYLTYNMLHKPALLGILGAIAGMKGYEQNGRFPDYYQRLKHLKTAILPLESNNGNYTKEIVSYNNSTGLASNESGGNLVVTEQILLKPAYRCFLLLNPDNPDEQTLYDTILSYKAEFLPYLGKNDFSAWWVNAKEYSSIEKFDFKHDYKVASIFAKTEAVKNFVAKNMNLFASRAKEPEFFYFEKLPVGFDETLFQYTYADFVYSNVTFKASMNMSEAGDFYRINTEDIIQLF
ncbi:MAG: type I-B CRISPR-associated protein Cas5b [Parabacteroides sp.]|nr:type I-B CRISPR-associated protein Cas5b [Parabacteroides sp.]